MSERVKYKRKVIERLFNDKYQQLFYYAYDKILAIFSIFA